MTKFYLLLLLLLCPLLSAAQVPSGTLESNLGQSLKTLKSIETKVECPDPEIVTDGKNYSVLCANGEEAELSVLTENEMSALFNKLKGSDIPFGYPEDGCYARAHKMCMLMDKEGIKSAKVFVEGWLEVKTDVTPNGKINWWYHVAPIILMKDNKGMIQKMVIDPSIMDKAVPLETWVKEMTSCELCLKTNQYFTAKFNYVPAYKNEKLSKYPFTKEMDKTLSDYTKVVSERLLIKQNIKGTK